MSSPMFHPLSILDEPSGLTRFAIFRFTVFSVSVVVVILRRTSSRPRPISIYMHPAYLDRCCDAHRQTLNGHALTHPALFIPPLLFIAIP